MKRFYNNTIMSGAFSKALRVVALLCVLLGVSGSAWAGFWLKSANIAINGTNDADWVGELASSGQSDIALGIVNNAPVIKGAWIRTGINNNNGNACGAVLYYKIDDGGEKSVSLSYNSEYTENNGNDIIQLWMNKDFTSETATSEGDHTIEFWFKATGHESNTGNCDQSLWYSNNSNNYKITYTIAGGDDPTPGGSECDQTGDFYITGAPFGNWGTWHKMEPTSDGKGFYYYLAPNAGDFKMSNQQNYDDTFWKSVQVSDKCTTITYSGDGSNANLSIGNVYIKYNPCTGYIWTDPIDCTEEPVYSVPSTITLAFGESIDLSKVCTSTSDADFTYSIMSGTTSVSISGTTLTAKSVAGTAEITAKQALKSPYCSGSVTFTVVVVEESDVLLAEDAKQEANKNWTLSGYLEKTNCTDITEYGFILCGSETEGGCTPTYADNDIKITTEGALEKGQHFTGLVNNNDLTSEWYGYRAYIINDSKVQVSSETRYFSPCNMVFGDTIYVTIDNSLIANDKCDFRFKNFEDAWATLKNYSNICTTQNITVGSTTQTQYTLVKPIVMQVVPTGTNYVGDEKVGLSGGDMNEVKAIFFRNINYNGGKPLIVRSIDKSATRATLQHVVIRRSKNITLDYLNLTGSSKDVADADNAMDIDSGEGAGNTEGLGTNWNSVPLGGIVDANINIKNCLVESYGFTCLHVAAYDGITFENNEFKAMYDFVNSTKKDNTANWGASAKFINCKNIKFVRNNFTGQHATSILLQGTQSVLIYNNVFWHENAVQTNVNTVAIIRLSSFGSNNPLQNIGIYYNTMFLKDNSVGAGYYNYFDFFRIGGSQQTGNTGNYDPETIEFDYNNCYSYDTDVYGKNTASGASHYLQTMSESDWCGSFKYNNFWSAYEETQNPKPTRSAFELGTGCGTENTFTNVQDLVCRTSPEEPGSLVIKGNSLNTGAFIKTDASELLTTEMQKIDRLGNPRPYDPNTTEGVGEYTIGAYQQGEGTEVSQIIWHGSTSTEWDNRNNWYKTNGQLVTCVDVLTEDLEVIIPAPNTTKYPVPEGGVAEYPKLPAIADEDDFSTKRTADWYGEEVSAGKGKISTPTKVANGITMEYGAALIGVEQLAAEGKTERYTQASTELIVPRSKWILVGPIIRPFDGNGEAGDMLSGHYFIEKQLPHVWMHEAKMSGNNVSWKNPFPDLNIEVPANKVFAIQIPDMYGTNLMFPAELYNKYFSTSYDATQPIAYTFNGRFTNESALPTYKGLTEGQSVLLNNSYPANINIDVMKSKTGGTVQIYDYDDKSFRLAEATELIIAQHGFVYTPSKSADLTIPAEAFEVSNTEHRSAAEYMPEVSIRVSNQSAEASSMVNLTIDWLKDDVVNYDTDAPKVFNAQETKLPDLYIMRYNQKWAGVRVPTYEEPIPLGIRVSATGQTFVFSLDNVVDMATVILEDRQEGKTYDLLAGEICTVTDLAVGDCEGRFFLNVGAKEQTEDEVTTDIEENLSDKGINILSKGHRIIVSSNNEVELQTIIVNDMSGKSAVYNVSGQYVELNLPVTQGVYTVKVIGDNATKIGKVILK